MCALLTSMINICAPHRSNVFQRVRFKFLSCICLIAYLQVFFGFYLCLILSYGILLYAFNESSPKTYYYLLFVDRCSFPFRSVLFLFFFQYVFVGVLRPVFFSSRRNSQLRYCFSCTFFWFKKKANWKSFEHQSERKSSNRPYWYCSLLKQVRHKQFNFHKAQIRKYEQKCVSATTKSVVFFMAEMCAKSLLYYYYLGVVVALWRCYCWKMV